MNVLNMILLALACGLSFGLAFVLVWRVNEWLAHQSRRAKYHRYQSARRQPRYPQLIKRLLPERGKS